MAAIDGESDGLSRRKRIVVEATKLFLEKGFAATSMSRVAEASGIHKATLYHHIASKEALFVACATDGFEEAITELELLCSDTSLTDEERFRRAIATVYRIILETGCGRMSPLIAEVSRTIPEVARAFHDQFIQRQHVLLNRIIDHGVEQGSFHTQERLGLENMIFGPIVSLSLEREMFTTFDNIDAMRPVDRIRDEHTTLLLRLLQAK